MTHSMRGTDKILHSVKQGKTGKTKDVALALGQRGLCYDIHLTNTNEDIQHKSHSPKRQRG